MAVAPGRHAADHHVVVAVGVVHQVPAQHVVRVVVLSSDQAIQIRIVHAEDVFAR